MCSGRVSERVNQEKWEPAKTSGRASSHSMAEREKRVRVTPGTRRKEERRENEEKATTN